jgi:hypothetical protein
MITSSCDKPHRLRTVDEKTLAEKTFDEWWEKDREGWQSLERHGRRQIWGGWVQWGRWGGKGGVQGRDI